MPPEPRQSDRPIVLVGAMGAGKSTVGRLLAARLTLPFLDLDEEIERTVGLVVREIFERFGEERFRQEERRALARLAKGPPRVIATGGGAFLDEGTRVLVLQHCLAIWLDAPIGTLAARVGRDRERPLLHGRDAHEVLRTLAAARNRDYARAHLTVSSEGRSAAQTVEAVLETLAERAP